MAFLHTHFQGCLRQRQVAKEPTLICVEPVFLGAAELTYNHSSADRVLQTKGTTGGKVGSLWAKGPVG